MSSLKKRFEDGEFEHFILVEDSGYPNTTFLATPFLNVTNAVENLYNESQIRTRNCVERSYGVWKRRFPVLATGLRCRLDTVQSVIVACAVLHNIAIDQNESQPPPEMYDFANILAATDVPSDTLLGSASATTHNVRARLMRSYFQPMLDS
ncbi:putative nuclease HARBI1 [Eupeodes corollae]|uniref:putative nuclease HARBI1 n=1 Tax=Eupeodes corollae TaxID=290404 RepID=UPI002490EB0D|nr:putative nuclease HARBI1 [Eupeodes corollae]